MTETADNSGLAIAIIVCAFAFGLGFICGCLVMAIVQA